MGGLVGGWVGGWVALEEWKLRLTSAKVEVEVENELGKRESYLLFEHVLSSYYVPL